MQAALPTLLNPSKRNLCPLLTEAEALDQEALFDPVDLEILSVLTQHGHSWAQNMLILVRH